MQLGSRKIDSKKEPKVKLKRMKNSQLSRSNSNSIGDAAGKKAEKKESGENEVSYFSGGFL